MTREPKTALEKLQQWPTPTAQLSAALQVPEVAALVKAAVDAEREACAIIADYSGVKQMTSDGSYSHHEPVMGPNVAAAIRARANGGE